METPVWNVVDLARDFIRKETVTPRDNGLQALIISLLKTMGFSVELLPFKEVHNFYARLGSRPPVFCFAGHTDVVPPGPPEEWTVPPYSGELKNGLLYGRGAADMKGALAAMISSVHDFLDAAPPKHGSIAFLITGDEEGAAVNGTAKVIEWLKQKGERIDYCLVGEPTSVRQVGDTVKNGRRGSINGHLTLFGIQGHVAYPHLADNPLHEGLEILKQIIQLRFDDGNAFFDPTHLTLTHLQGGAGRDNLIPDRLEVRFNIRYGTASTFHSIKTRLEGLLNQSGKKFSLRLDLAGEAFLTQGGFLLDSILKTVEEEKGFRPDLSTSGGTSDARFIAPEGIEVSELGLKHDTIHKINEHVSIDDLRSLTKIYKKLLTRILLPEASSSPGNPA